MWMYPHKCICEHTHKCVYIYICCILYTCMPGNGCRVLFLMRIVPITVSVSLHNYSPENNLALCSQNHIQNGRIYSDRKVCAGFLSRVQAFKEFQRYNSYFGCLCLPPIGSWWHSEWFPSCLLWEGLWIWRLSSTDPVRTSCRTQTQAWIFRVITSNF